MQQARKLFILLSLVCFLQSIQASGVFELSLSSLVDSLGRDLRDDCCAWQNASSNQAANHLPQHQTNQQAACDPSKCQLIIRICVKNYQTQIEPSQCTFGELSAQVLSRQFSDDSMLGASNSLPVQYQPLVRRSTTQRPSSFLSAATRSAAAAPPPNIHHQRMLSQTQALPPFFYQQQQATHQSAAARNHQQQLRSPLSGQPRALRTVAFHQPISFPFNFTWPGSFSLIIDAWFESPLQQVAAAAAANHHHHHHLSAQLANQSPTTTYDLYKRQLIIKHSMRGWLAVKNEWTNDVHKTDAASLSYSYRVTCQTNYYGEQCNILCRPRDDFYGHYTCSQQGNIVCLPGWQGSYCLEPICSPSCHQEHGNCSRPNECTCRHGWQGSVCEQCVLYPGCVHGSCNKPFDCNCDIGWGGLLCNEDLNYCSNHQPCKNDGLCSNHFDSNGVGSYACECSPAFAGKNCERRADQDPSVVVDTPIVNQNLSLHQQRLKQQRLEQEQEREIQVAQQQVEQTSTQAPVKKQPTKQPASNQHLKQANRSARPATDYPLYQATLAHHSSQPLDSWVMIGWAVIMVCSIILVLVFSFRQAIEKANQRAGAQSGWHHHQEGGHAEDVATLQNQQNLCKSRTSLNVANMMGTDHKSHYDRVLSLVDGHEHMAGLYGYSLNTNQQPGTSIGIQHHYNNNNNNNNQNNKRRGDKAKKSHNQKQQQQYQSQHNLHATHENNNSSDSSEDAASTSSETLAPPPPYTIAQSTHSYPNLAYQSLSSHYGSAAAASAHYLPLPAAAAAAAAAAANQRAPKAGASQVTAISNAIYGSNTLYGGYSTYAGIPVVANRQQATTANGSDGSAGGSGGNNAAAAAAAANHYLIYPVHFMAS